MVVARVGLDIAKNVFQVHAVGSDDRVVVRRQLRRHQVLAFFGDLPRCVIGIEACPGAHHWGRQLTAMGHEVRLMPPQYVKPYVKRQKNDSADAEAICEAMGRPTMRFVPIKTEEQQSILMLHRTRELLVRQKGMLINALRAQLHEFGIIAAQGRVGLGDLVTLVLDTENRCIPELAREAMTMLISQLKESIGRLRALEARIIEQHRSNEISRRCRLFQGSGRLSHRRLLPRSPIRKPFAMGANSPPGSVLCRVRARREARSGLAVLPNGATLTSESCLSSRPAL